MAREQRYDVDYFPHACNHGRKMHIIETKYNNDGYAIWFKMLEQLGKANHHFIDISDELNFSYLISIFKVEQTVAESILSDLAKIGAIDKDLYENHQIIYSHKFIESISDAYKKRKSEPLSPDEILEKVRDIKNHSATETIQSDAETHQSGTETPQKGGNPPESIPKGKKSKEKERKGENITRAYELIKNQKPSEINIFEMQNKKQVKKWRDLVEAFNDKMDIEVSQGKIEWKVDQLFPRLRSWTRSWISNENDKKEKFTPKPDSYESGKLPRL